MNKQDEARIRKIVAEELAKAGVKFVPLAPCIGLPPPRYFEPPTGVDPRWTNTFVTSAR